MDKEMLNKYKSLGVNVTHVDCNAVMAADFEVLATHGREPAAMAVMVKPKGGDKFVMPMDVKTALDLGTMLVQTAMGLNPGLFTEWLSQ